MSGSASAARPAEMRTWDGAQAATFLATAAREGLQWHAYFAVALTTGMRLSELAGLRWEDVDLASRTLAVRQTIQRVPAMGRIVKAPKTAKSRQGCQGAGSTQQDTLRTGPPAVAKTTTQAAFVLSRPVGRR